MNCIIIHGCPSNKEKATNAETRTYDKHWIPWTKKELIKRGFPTETPLMPEPWEPDYQKFKMEFDKQKVTKDTILIGHSCGCAFLVRWLGDTGKKINKLILVAPWKTTENEKDLRRKEFYRYKIKDNVKDNINKTIIFTADNEGAGGKKSAVIFHDALGGKIMNLHGRGHYTFNDMGTEEFPELIEAVLA